MSDAVFAYGVHAVEALLAVSPERILDVQALESREDARLNALLRQVRQAGVSIAWRDRAALDKLVDGARHQGIVVRLKPRAPGHEGDLAALLDTLAVPPFLLILDGVTDPHNLGACLRTAEAAGVHAVIAPKDKASGLTATARKVACGAAEWVPFFQVTNLARTLRDLQERGVWLVGTQLDPQAKPFYDLDLRGSLALVMGAEGSGLRRLTAEHCDHLAYVPMAGVTESLNVSVATGVVLFEAVRQRRT